MGHDVSLEAFQRYLVGVKAPQTVKKYVPCVRHFLAYMGEKEFRSFATLPSGFLGEYISELTQSGKNASTVRVYAFAVKQYLDWVHGKGIKVSHQSVKNLPKKTHTIRSVLKQNRFGEYFLLIDQELEEPIRTAAMLLPCSGLRASEMVNLTLGDIQTAEVKLKKKGKTFKKKTLILKVRGKGGKERHVPLMEEGVEILTGYLATWRKKRPGSWLFPQVYRKKGKKDGKKPVSDNELREGLRVVRERMGLDFTPHTMRRTYITMLYEKGVDLKIIADIAGHASLQTTADHYINMSPSHALKRFHEASGSLMEE